MYKDTTGSTSSTKIKIQDWDNSYNSNTTAEFSPMADWSHHHDTSTGNSAMQIQIDQSSPTGTDDCNESLKHSNIEKSIFHAMKGANRLLDEEQQWAALEIAATVATSFLETEDMTYDAERSEEYLDEELVEDAMSTVDVIEAGVERAWEKIDSGHHVGGARIAVSLADAYLDGFALPESLS